MDSQIIEKAKDLIHVLFSDRPDGHDVNHTLRVYSTALEIALYYPEADKELVALSALLHDVDDYKLFNTKNNANARSFLVSQNISEGKINQIIAIINSVSFSKNKCQVPSTLEGKIVQDADRLDAIGAIGIARCFAFGGKNERSMEESINHFHEKLLLLKDLMNTDVAKAKAEERHAYMENFLKELDKEGLSGVLPFDEAK